jgi:hypothetical protein
VLIFGEKFGLNGGSIRRFTNQALFWISSGDMVI